MSEFHQSQGTALVASVLNHRAETLLAKLDLDDALAHVAANGEVSRICFAAALNALLFHDLLDRVPTGAAFVAEQFARGERVCMDHGAVRTVLFADKHTGALPAGHKAISRILMPIGYHVAGVYPLPRLGMTGYALSHLDLPEQIPQFFVSELHVDRYGPEFAAAAHRVFGDSADPLDAFTISVLDRFAQTGTAPLASAVRALPQILLAFGRQHTDPELVDYGILLGHSSEAAWIATEGNAFNHATSRVVDVDAEAEHQRLIGRPIKDAVEISTNGRVRQSAFKADPVVRTFRDGCNAVERSVPGSFYEIISRARLPDTDGLDLTFDSASASNIFTMTQAA
ncbi:2-oxoadipate dioxygenase/decarboxylase family protein [Blastomonas fulva]|uniref:2-oxoadipate dioxygenase/decarboxylase family protein n=1 Tax=Blastomonas fulva TaxID=1550728 RepID=UPI003F6E83C6